MYSTAGWASLCASLSLSSSPLQESPLSPDRLASRKRWTSLDAPTRGRRLGVKGSQVQILSARPVEPPLNCGKRGSGGGSRFELRCRPVASLADRATGRSPVQTRGGGATPVVGHLLVVNGGSPGGEFAPHVWRVDGAERNPLQGLPRRPVTSPASQVTGRSRVLVTLKSFQTYLDALEITAGKTPRELHAEAEAKAFDNRTKTAASASGSAGATASAGPRDGVLPRPQERGDDEREARRCASPGAWADSVPCCSVTRQGRGPIAAVRMATTRPSSAASAGWGTRSLPRPDPN